MSTDPRSPSSRSGSKPAGAWQPPSMEEMQVLLPAYRFECLLGRGGMGAVYKAIQISLDRPVAIKVLPSELIDDTDANFLERFKNEARTMARLSHPSIVNVYEFGETASGLLYIVMEFINGTDVSKMITSQGRLPEDYALSITAHVCDALAYAHRNGVIHRDIKPANILINMDGAVKVADFGLAKESDPAMSGLTKTNMAMGTPDFVAPEALIPGIPLDGRADLYAIGVMLYQMLSGEIPRGMWTMPGLKLGTDPRFDSIIAKAMQTDREARYQSAAEIRQDLDTILTAPRGMVQPQAAPPTHTTAPPAQRPPQTGPRTPQKKASVSDKAAQVPPVPAKSKSGLFIGLGVTAAVLTGAGLFLSPGKKEVPSKKAVASASPTPKPAPKPAPSAPSPAPSSLPLPPKRKAIQTLDLLALTDPVQDRVSAGGMSDKNEWKREGTALVFQPDGKSGKLAVPVAFNCTDYEIEFKAVKHIGNDRIHVDLPLKDGRILPLILNGQGRRVINEREGAAWGSPDREVHVSIRVIDGPGAADRIVIQRLNYKESPLANWSGDLNQYTKSGEAHPAFPGEPLASVFVMRDKYEVQTWTLRVFEGTAKVLRSVNAPPPAPKVIASAASIPPAVVPVKAVMPSPPVATPPVMPAPPAAPSTPPASSDPVSLKLADLESKFQATLERTAGAAYKAQLATLNTGYTAALDREMAAATKAGELNDVLVFREEKQRIVDGKGLPPEDLVALPESLKKLRATWRSAEAGYSRIRDAKAEPLLNTYDKALAAFQTELTQQNKIEDALRVKALREEMAKRRESSPIAAEQPPQPATTAKPPANVSNTSNERSSSWRRLAEWVLRNTGGDVVYVAQGARMSARDVKDLPAGRFEITEVHFGNRGMDDVTDDDMTRFAGNREIQTLRMNAPKVTLKGLAVLKELPKLKDITFLKTPLGEGFMSLLAGHKELAKLQIRDFEKGTLNGIGELASHGRLQSLETMTNVAFDDADFAQIGKLKSLTSLHMQGTFKVSSASMVSLAGLTRLEDLMLSVSGNFPNGSLQPLSALTRLQTLSLGRIDFRTADGSFIGKLPVLETANLDSCSVTDELVASWNKCSQLSSLLLLSNPLTGSGLAHLASAGKLKTLSLYNCPISEEGGLTLASLPALEWLSISKVSDTTLHNICQSRSITKLSCAHHLDNILTASMIAEIKTMPALEKLDLQLRMQQATDLEPLAQATKLRELLLQFNQIDPTWLPSLGKLQQITRLYIRDSKLTDADLTALGKLLPKCRVIR